MTKQTYGRTKTGESIDGDLIDRLSDLDGEPPPVIDSVELLEPPAELVETWCAHRVVGA